MNIPGYEDYDFEERFILRDTIIRNKKHILVSTVKLPDFVFGPNDEKRYIYETMAFYICPDCGQIISEPIYSNVEYDKIEATKKHKRVISDTKDVILKLKRQRKRFKMELRKTIKYTQKMIKNCTLKSFREILARKSEING